jgi:NAD(P)-dependent dehydrogenase (short-subunit alcohol dehydrogenase family)
MSEVVVVTGAGKGIGRTIVRRFAGPDVSLGLVGRGEEALEAARHEVEAAGGWAMVVRTDVSDAAAVDAAARKVEESLGEIDIWVNNAMTTVFAFFEDIEPEEYERATKVTYLGLVWGTRAALRRMLPATAARSSRSARRWRIAASRSSRRTAARRRRSRVFNSRFAPSGGTRARRST